MSSLSAPILVSLDANAVSCSGSRVQGSAANEMHLAGIVRPLSRHNAHISRNKRCEKRCAGCGFLCLIFPGKGSGLSAQD